MATVSYLCGFEWGDAGEAFSTSGSPTFVSGSAASGAFGMRCNASGAAVFAAIGRTRAAGGTSSVRNKSARFKMRIDVAPSGACIIAGKYSTAAVVTDTLILNADRTLSIADNTATRATSTLTVSTGVLHRIEWDVQWNAGVGAQVSVDGVLYVSDAGNTYAGSAAELRIGVVSAVTADLSFDDIVVYSTNLDTPTWEDWNVILLKAISDNARGNWVGGASGTTNLWQALDNQPPAGLTTGSDTNTSQIQNGTNATYPATAAQAGDFNCQSYATGGIVAEDTVHATQAICSHGEGIATGTKAGGLFIVSNPADSSPGQSFDFGDDAGAIGTYPTNWKTAYGPATTDPSVTLGTSPVVRVFKNDASTREAHVDFLGIYVAYSPAATGKSPPPRPIAQRFPHVMR